MSYIRFVEEPNDGRKTKVFVVKNARADDSLAVISFYPRWRQYVAEFFEGCVFSDGCLQEIQEFVARQNEERKAALPTKEGSKK